MAMAGAVPGIVVLALGAGALGGPDALRLLVALAGQNPVVDVGICVFVFAVVTAQLLGAALLVRFVLNAPAAGHGGAGRGAPATADYLARVTLLLSLAAASLVTACLVVVSGGLGSFCVLVDFAAEYYRIVMVIAAEYYRIVMFIAAEYYRIVIVIVIAAAAEYYRIVIVIVIAAAAAAVAASLHYVMPLLRERQNARGTAPARRSTTTHRTVRFVGPPLVAAVCALLVATPSLARVGLDALRRSPGFTIMSVAVAVYALLVATPSVARRGLDALRRSPVTPVFTIMSVAVAVAVVVCATLLAHSYLRARA